jgi:hypothetical protein
MENNNKSAELVYTIVAILIFALIGIAIGFRFFRTSVPVVELPSEPQEVPAVAETPAKTIPPSPWDGYEGK